MVFVNKTFLKILFGLRFDLSNFFLESGILDNQYGLLKKKILITYKREYFSINNIRFTLDYDIEYRDLKSSQIFFDQPKK